MSYDFQIDGKQTSYQSLSVWKFHVNITIYFAFIFFSLLGSWLEFLIDAVCARVNNHSGCFTYASSSSWSGACEIWLVTQHIKKPRERKIKSCELYDAWQSGGRY